MSSIDCNSTAYCTWLEASPDLAVVLVDAAATAPGSSGPFAHRAPALLPLLEHYVNASEIPDFLCLNCFSTHHGVAECPSCQRSESSTHRTLV